MNDDPLPRNFCEVPELPMKFASAPPEGYVFYAGPHDWRKLPNGSLIWQRDGTKWENLVEGASACPGKQIYAVPILTLPNIPKDPAPRLTILEEAQDLVNGDRQADYGDAYESFARIAKMWSAYLDTKLKGAERVTPKDVADMMILMKVSRSVTSSKRDNWVDKAGYAELGSQVEAREAAPE
jgi:hypothetical protein